MRSIVSLAILALLAAGCGSEVPEPDGQGADAQVVEDAPAAASTSATSAPLFVEVAAEAGLDFVHFNGMTGELYYSEVMAGGLALFDYDGDGDLDVYLPQGHLLGRDATMDDAVFPPPSGEIPHDRLYRNDLELGPDGRPVLRFTDVTDEIGLPMELLEKGYGMGAAVGDVDDDGHPDLYVTQWGGPNRLFRNRGDGTFEDLTEAAGVGEIRWSVPAVFFDADADGRLDLYVGNYLRHSLELEVDCVSATGTVDYCGPVSFEPARDTFYRNLGSAADGGPVAFADVTVEAGIRQAPAPTLGALSGDFDGDGRLDLYLANDEYPNNLLINQGPAAGGFVTFRDEARVAGAAMNDEGQAEAGMGVDAGDYDGDGDEDLFVAHLTGETNTLYRNEGGGLFVDQTRAAGLAAPSVPFTGFGAGFLDFDNDGRLDVLVVNGAVRGLPARVMEEDPYPLDQPDQLYRNAGGGRFEDVSAAAGPALALETVSRGAAFGDLDNDGDTDVVVLDSAGPVRLLRNEVGQDRPWIGLRLVGGDGPRDMLGAVVEILAPGPPQLRRVRTGWSYASANDPRVLFGLGGVPADALGAAAVRVTWPDGSVETWEGLEVRRYTTLRQGGAAGRGTDADAHAGAESR